MGFTFSKFADFSPSAFYGISETLRKPTFNVNSEENPVFTCAIDE